MTLAQNIHLFWLLLPWLLSGFTFAVMYLAGNKDIRAWYVGLFAQVLWIIFDIHLSQWGLTPIGFALVFVYVRNIMSWSGFKWSEYLYTLRHGYGYRIKDWRASDES